MPFPHPIAIVATRDGHSFIVEKPIEYVTNAGQRIIIPIGATTDGASTPQPMWNVLPPFGDYFLAALLHDALYRNYAVDEQDNRLALDREDCDALLFEAMVSLGVPEATRTAIYDGVRLGGHWAFVADRA